MDRRSQPARRLESSYPFVHELHSQFRDLDPLRHVNNVVVAAYYEDARVHFLTHLWGGGPGRAAGRPYFLVANVDIDYLGEANHPRAFRIGVGAGRIGRTSLVVSLALFQEGTCIGLCDSTLVHMDDAGVRALDDEQRAVLAPMATDFSPQSRTAPAGSL